MALDGRVDRSLSTGLRLAATIGCDFQSKHPRRRFLDACHQFLRYLVVLPVIWRNLNFRMDMPPDLHKQETKTSLLDFIWCSLSCWCFGFIRQISPTEFRNRRDCRGVNPFWVSTVSIGIPKRINLEIRASNKAISPQERLDVRKQIVFNSLLPNIIS